MNRFMYRHPHLRERQSRRIGTSRIARRGASWSLFTFRYRVLDCPFKTGEQPVSTYDAMVFLVGIPMMMAVCLVALTVVRRAV